MITSSTNESRCILLSATPYNKSYLDLSAQLRLFIGEEDVLGIRPEQYLKTVGEAQFQQQFQAHPRSIIAFEKSESRGRLARSDAPLPGAPYPQLHRE